MDTTARRALSELIDQLRQPSPAEPAVAGTAVSEPAVAGPAVAELPVQRAPEPPQTRPQAVTVLPGPARSAILWRSRSA